MILIKITKEDREPEVGEWYHAPDAKFFGRATNEHNDYMYIACKALSISAILDAPEVEFDDVSDYWRETDINRLTSYPIANSEEIFQWLHDQRKLGEEWVEWEGEAFSRMDGSIELILPIDEDDLVSNFKPKKTIKIKAKVLNVTESSETNPIHLLRKLADLQNGPPLERDRKEWEEAMTKIYDFLEKHEKTLNQ